jgi:hypothetical protein
MLCRQTTFVRALMAQTHASQTRVRAVTGEVLDLCGVPARDRSASLSRGCTCAEYALEDGLAPKDLRHGLRRPGRVCSSAAAFLAVCAALAADVLIPTGGPLIVNIDGDLVQVAPAMASHCARVRPEHAVLVCIGLSPRAQPRHPLSERAQADQEQTNSALCRSESLRARSAISVVEARTRMACTPKSIW